MKFHLQVLISLLLLALEVRGKSVGEPVTKLRSVVTEDLINIQEPSKVAKDPVSNQDIMSMLKHILDRLNIIDTNFGDLKKSVGTNRAATSHLQKQVEVNQGVLLNIREHLQDQEMKVHEVIQKTQEEEKEIKSNKEMVGKVARQNDKITELLTKNLKNITRDVKDVKRVLTEVLPGRGESAPAPSCKWLKSHSYCVPNGNYWIQQDGGNTSLQYCKMDDERPVTTTVAPTTTERPTTEPVTTTVASTTAITTTAPSTTEPVTTTVAPTTAITTTAPPTTEPVHHGASCKELKQQHPHLKSGTYTLTVGGKTFDAVCDMETDNGGWLMVGQAVVDKEEDAKLVDWHTIRQDDYTTVHKVTTGRYLLSVTGLRVFYDKSPFSEIRFDCKKPSHGRRLHLKTIGAEILMWLLKRRSHDPNPRSCGSYSRMRGDTSIIGGDCRKWWNGGGQEWNFQEIYDIPMRAKDESGYYHHIGLNYNKWKYLYCDDDETNPGNFSNKGRWQFFVR